MEASSLSRQRITSLSLLEMAPRRMGRNCEDGTRHKADVEMMKRAEKGGVALLEMEI